ncbi:MAG: polysaccharide biosynthesis tyrosine autokinase [Anaerolineales bacterium]|nr:polysaccharide biosynthesis tyrosine autokinase [Anaerolineales bacterium]
MEIRKYVLLLKKWLWLLVIGGIAGGAGGFLLSRFTTPVYQAQTKILVTSNRQDPNFEFAYLSDQQLLETYIEILQTKPILDAVIQKVGFAVDPRQIAIVQVRQTQIILIAVEDEDPLRAAEVANTLVDVLIEQSENLQAGRYASVEASLQVQIQQVERQIEQLRTEFDQISQQEIQEQLSQVDEQIKVLQDEVSTLEKDIARLSTTPLNETREQMAARQAQLNEKQAQLQRVQPLLLNYQQIRSNLLFLGQPALGANTRSDFRTLQLQSTISLYQQLYLNLLNNLESLQLLRLQYTPNIDQIEPATPPERPVRPAKLRYLVMGIVAGVALLGAVAAGIEFLDDTIKSPKDVTQHLGLQTIASIQEFNGKRLKDEEIFILKNPKSPAADAYRLLRTGILYGVKGGVIKTLLIVSPDTGDGRSAVALNLAASFSLLGKRVAVVDANIRNPRLHTTLGMENRVGLGDVLTEKADLTAAMQPLEGQRNIRALTGGQIPESPTELLESDRLGQTLNKLTASVDMVILDGPPVFLADALAFASRVDGVLLVLRPGKTRIETAQAALEYLQRAGANILGVVFNRVPRRWTTYHEGFYFSSEELARIKR